MNAAVLRALETITAYAELNQADAYQIVSSLQFVHFYFPSFLLHAQVFQRNWNEAHEMFKAKVQTIKKVGIDSKGNVVPDDDDDDDESGAPSDKVKIEESDHTGWLEAKAKAAAAGASSAAGASVHESSGAGGMAEGIDAGEEVEPAPYETLAEKTAKLELGKKAVTRAAQEQVVEAGTDGAYEV